MSIADSNYIKACYGKNTGPIPIWIMRQAGRYLPEYQAVREKVSFLELCKTPELIAEVVRQPIARFNLDAGILFSDILIILEPMGMNVSFANGGPEISQPISSPDDIDRLHEFDVESKLSYVFEGIKKIKEILPESPLIGFAGSPFTIACYLIQGQGSKTFDRAKKFIHKYPESAARLLKMVTDITSRYLAAQIDAGVDSVQLFGSWDGILSRHDFIEYSVKPAEDIFGALKSKKAPRILFINNLAPYLDLVKDIDCEVIGVDYRMSLKQAADTLPGKSIQGNLDPTLLFGSVEQIKERAVSILDSVENHNRLIFNLGHGILPETPIESVKALVETVHNYR